VKACPHTGGALVAGAAGQLHALSWTGREGAAGLYAVASEDGGKTWKRTYRMGGGTAQRGDLAARGAALAAVWDENTASGVAVFASLSADGGAAWSPPRRLSAEGAHATHPRVAAVTGGFVAFWTEQTGKAPAILRQVRLGDAGRTPGKE
jgi:hypothetical protein